MQRKLTLRLDDRLIVNAKAHAKRRGTSVSRLVADYFSVLEGRPKGTRVELTPTVRSLKGALRGGQVDKRDYRKYLEEKYL